MCINSTTGISVSTTPEREVEREFVKRITRIGCLTRKLNGIGYRSWPDRLVVAPVGLSLYVELKAEGREPTPKQIVMLVRLRELGCHAAWFDNAEQAFYWVQRCIREHRAK